MPRLPSFAPVLAIMAASASAADMKFNRVAFSDTPLNMAAGEDMERETSAEIIAATEDGMRLVYTDSPLGVVGMIVNARQSTCGPQDRSRVTASAVSRICAIATGSARAWPGRGIPAAPASTESV